MRTLVWTAALVGLLLLAGLPTAAQDTPVTLRTVKYAGLAEAVVQQGGQVVVVDFWAFFCHPCKEKFPHLVELHRKYAAKGLTAISVSLDLPEQRAEAEQFLLKQKAAFTNLWLDETQDFWTNKFGFYGPPCVYVFDRRGRWTQFRTGAGKDVNYAEVEKLVVKLLAE